MSAAHALTLMLLAAVSGATPTAAPTSAPVRWTPQAIATSAYEATPTFSPDGKEMYYMTSDPAFRRYSLLVSRCEGGAWQPPAAPGFALPLPVFDGDPHVTADGERIYFISTRQNTAKDDEDFDIWMAHRRKDGTWSAPERLPEPVNSAGSELLPRTTADGRLFFGSDRAGGQGGMDIYEARRDAKGAWTVANLGGPVSTRHGEYEAEVSADGNTLVVVADRGDRSHLYVFERSATQWVERYRVPARADVFQVGPLLSPRKDRLLFAQAEPGRSGEMMLIDLVPHPDPAWPPVCSSAR